MASDYAAPIAIGMVAVATVICITSVVNAVVPAAINAVAGHRALERTSRSHCLCSLPARLRYCGLSRWPARQSVGG